MKRSITYLVLIQMAVLLAACQETDKIAVETNSESVVHSAAEANARSSSPAGLENPESAGVTVQPPVESQPERPAENAGGEMIVYNEEIFISCENNLEYQDKLYLGTYESNCFAQGIYIEGLRDHAVQKKINDKIKAETLRLYESGLPPYRGIHSLVSERDVDQLNCQVTGSVYYNEGNILSLALGKVMWSADYQTYIRTHVPLTFNLNNGELIPLSDLFAPGTDYQNALSEYVSSSVSDNELYKSTWKGFHGNEEQASFMLIRPFDKIKETQKYVITSNHQIMLLLDYDTPEFYVDMETEFLTIHAERLKESGARFVYATRYENDGESIYVEGNNQRKGLISGSLVDSRSYSLESPGMKDIFPVEYLEISTNVVRNIEDKTLAGQINTAVKQPDALVLAAIAADEIPLSSLSELSYRYGTQKFGHYLNEYEWYYAQTGENDSYTKRTYKVYDTLTGRQLHLRDCFTPGFDYLDALTAKVLADYPEGDADEFRSSLPGAEFSVYSHGIEIYMDNDIYYLFIPFHEVGEEHFSLLQ